MRFRRTAVVVAGALLVATSYVALRPLGVVDPRLAAGAAMPGPRGVPAVVRYVSANGTPAFGLVLEWVDGAPRRVVSLTAVEPRLGSSLASLVAHRGFDVAAERARAAPGSHPPAAVETIAAEELAARVLSPVDLSLAELDRAERVVLAIGLNYAGHRDEADRDVDVLLFAKHVAPTGSYADVPVGKDESGAARQLVDYELELGMIVLEEIDLDRLPASDAELQTRVAFVAANDVSDRVPIIADPDRGYTAGKSRPGYLPLGPVMVHGAALPPSPAGAPDLRLRLAVREPAGTTLRQDASAAELIRGPLEILREASRAPAAAAMADGTGVTRPLYVSRGGRRLLTAGSVVLTGTPRGTAIEAPRGLDLPTLFIRGGFTIAGAQQAWARHCTDKRRSMGFLTPGDVVEAEIQDLGRQRFSIVP
jgi:2-keto-4-pentenoate hydratase/2-oxohepta-3-ene-1,7-dioic acid hydratase in catechol pathway